MLHYKLIESKLQARLPTNVKCTLCEYKWTKYPLYVQNTCYTCFISDKNKTTKVLSKNYYGEHKMNDVVDAFLYLYLKNV